MVNPWHDWILLWNPSLIVRFIEECYEKFLEGTEYPICLIAGETEWMNYLISSAGHSETRLPFKKRQWSQVTYLRQAEIARALPHFLFLLVRVGLKCVKDQEWRFLNSLPALGPWVFPHTWFKLSASLMRISIKYYTLSKFTDCAKLGRAVGLLEGRKVLQRDLNVNLVTVCCQDILNNQISHFPRSLRKCMILVCLPFMRLFFFCLILKCF